MSQNPILITGAAGFVGLATTEALLTAGRTVIAFDRQPLPAWALARLQPLPGRLVVAQGDVREAGDLDAAFTAAGTMPGAVLHTAVITAGEARERTDPASIVSVNMMGALAVFEAVRRHGVKRLVAPSSIATYGQSPEGEPVLDEVATPARPQGLYGITKLAAEQMMLRLAALHGLSFAAPRLGGVYGPWEWATGVRDTLSPFMQAYEKAEKGQEVLTDWSAPAEHVYVRDVASGLAALLDTPSAQGVFNLGSGVQSTVGEWCDALAKQFPGFSWRMTSPGEAPNVTVHARFTRPPMNIARLKAATSWAPRFSLAAAAADYAEWQKGG
ncbi:NAD(P)-dependent oxidoreductase [Acetobacteraceae bacterium H6797]|nr:NAD(P)-dependent oxidoreductase [Acetobacteraceae bacterium H6797]